MIYFFLVMALLSLNACNLDNEQQNSQNDVYTRFSVQESDDQLQHRTNSNDTIIQDSPSLDEQSLFNVEPIVSYVDFKEKWNAISDEYTATHYISSFEHVNSHEESYDFAHLSPTLELRLYSQENNIDKISIHSVGTSSTEIVSMISSWWQLILVTNPNINPHDIDLLLADLGIGPNANVKELEQKAFTLGEIQYRVIPTDKGYLFETIL